ncbi:2-dehydro-3-deoxyphosphogluconate aldolase/(4S)-4-hydroxy-2-oxoglutarate aldolase [Roseovarius sp. MBR-78]|jgi:2-dehydro-3-deoxyphosphogluconate aldolase/(4S)-4-hydroxy-2-oxoglutarate aldolase|uniref:bifunctional 4-hydroxy-2-oxoglutarate aldolase/2-dehydro-3-deoxy-phosphogluconate aldolase n=1 Tax=Roseovarius sp. MBR-78 TaxID=3156460 RepID=UPI003396E443
MTDDLSAVLRTARIVPVIRHHDTRIAETACRLLVEEGARVLEITMTVPAANDLLRRLGAACPDVVLGAGTVLDAAEAQGAIAAGAGFIVSPCWCAEVAAVCHAAQVPYLPGAMTPGEVHHHAQAGAHVVKVFPADAAGGPGFLKALGTVFPDIALMPTGGVTPGNAADYLAAGALCVGMGGNLLPAAALEQGDEAGARDLIRAALAGAR